jgi:hypothetical protein
MSGNGHDKDEGLMAIRAAFEGAQYLDADGKECANLMMLGAHREQQIPDNLIVEVYASLTEGRNVQLKFVSDETQKGYVACIESYSDMLKLMQGELDATVLETG